MALEKWQGHDPDWVTGPTVEDKVWGCGQAHLFVSTGRGHGRGGVARGEAEMREVVPDSAVVDEAVRVMGLFADTGIKAEVIADENMSYCVLESAHLTDEESQKWWGAVTRVLCKGIA